MAHESFQPEKALSMTLNIHAPDGAGQVMALGAGRCFRCSCLLVC